MLIDGDENDEKIRQVDDHEGAMLLAVLSALKDEGMQVFWSDMTSDYQIDKKYFYAGVQFIGEENPMSGRWKVSRFPVILKGLIFHNDFPEKNTVPPYDELLTSKEAFQIMKDSGMDIEELRDQIKREGKSNPQDNILWSKEKAEELDKPYMPQVPKNEIMNSFALYNLARVGGVETFLSFANDKGTDNPTSFYMWLKTKKAEKWRVVRFPLEFYYKEADLRLFPHLDRCPADSEIYTLRELKQIALEKEKD
jgi:hypothetical protein